MTQKKCSESANGTYANIQVRPKLIFLGSNKNWQSVLIDIRHYMNLPVSSHNILLSGVIM